MSTNQTIPANTYIGDLIPSRFLKVEDLAERWKVTQIPVTICRVAQVDTIPNLKHIDPATSKPRVVMQTVLYFKTKTGAEFHRGYLLSAREDLESLKAATGAQRAGDLIGKRILIFIAEFRKKPVLRIAPTPPEEKEPARANGQQSELTYKKSPGAPDLPPMPGE